MADEQYRWLDRETAERLLRGESLEAVDPADRDQAERLAKTLEALTAEPPLSSTELPGEAAALAAFRTARADRRTTPAALGDDAGSGSRDPSDVGLVRLGGPVRDDRGRRRGRPLRLTLAAALAVCTVGGVAVAAGTGVLPTPFRGGEPARPAASATAGVPPERPLVSPSPEGGTRGEPTPDGGSGAPTGGTGVTEDTSPGGAATGAAPSAGARGRDAGGWWRTVVSSCRDVRDGKLLDDDRRRALQGAAGGNERVRTYCKKVLKLTGGNSPGRSVRDRDRDRGDGDGDSGDRDGDGGRGDDRDGSHRGGSHRGGSHRDGGRGSGPLGDRDRDDRRADGPGTGGPSPAGRLPDGVGALAPR